MSYTVYQRENHQTPLFIYNLTVGMTVGLGVAEGPNAMIRQE